MHDARRGGHHEDPGEKVGGGSDLPRIPSDVFVEIVRVLIIALTTAVGDGARGGPGAALGACTGYVVGGVAGRWLRRATGRFESAVQRTPAITLAAGVIGALAAGGVAAIAGIAAFVLLPGRWAWPIVGVFSWTGLYAGFQIGARKGSELLLVLRRGSTVLGDRPGPSVVLVDSSAAMDGRLLTLASAGFLPGDLAVPRFVLDELHGLADAADPTRRRRAQRGLETLEVLRVDGPGLVVLPDEVPERDDVDGKLVALALRLGARVLTADRGLAGVGGAEGVTCLDVARLAEGLQPVLVPGDLVSVRLTRAGRDRGQGVGFLADGTMVVVSEAADRLGTAVDAEVVSSVPTAKGRLFFARLAM